MADDDSLFCRLPDRLEVDCTETEGGGAKAKAVAEALDGCKCGGC